MSTDFDYNDVPFDYDDSRYDSFDDPYDGHHDERTIVSPGYHDKLKKRNDNSGCLTAFYAVIIIIAIFVVWWAIGRAFLACECAVIKWFPESPPYYTTDDDRYHRDNCPYMTEDNYVGDEFDSRAEAEGAGYKPCPHCLE